MQKQCFGFIATYSDTSSVCKECRSREACKDKVVERLSDLSESMDVGDLFYILNRDSSVTKLVSSNALTVVTGNKERAVRQTRFKLTSRQKELLASVKARYTKSERLVRSMFRNGIDLRGSLLAGTNPFVQAKSHTYMRVACDLLLKGGFTRVELRDALRQSFNWEKTTANAHVLVCTHAFDAMGITGELQGKFTIKEVA